MIVRERVPLSTLTSFRVGGPARFVIEAKNEEELQEAFSFARTKNLPYYLLGGGSNVLVPDRGYEGVVIIPRFEELSFEGDEVTAGAGVPWERLVEESALRGLWGIENLAGIPGSVGASPVQNIGAYGTEVKDTISFVEAMRRDDGSVHRFSNEACEFSYRDSVFKRSERYAIMRVGFRLTQSGKPNLSYPDLVRAQEEGAPLSTPKEIGNAVRRIRAKKFPDLKEFGTAGSFFKNPMVSVEAFETLRARYPELPGYAGTDGTKISLAFVLDKVLGLRGYRKGSAWLYDQQPLVLVVDEGGSADDIMALADEVMERVIHATNIKIEREVRVLH